MTLLPCLGGVLHLASQPGGHAAKHVNVSAAILKQHPQQAAPEEWLQAPQPPHLG
jgi:hypothetical protein